jgi:hypothetical protein
VGLLLTIGSAQSYAQDDPNNLIPDSFKGIITVLKPGDKPDTKTYVEENSRDGLRLRGVHRANPAPPYNRFSYLMAWRQDASGKLPVLLTIAGTPAVKQIDYDAWREEAGPKENGVDGHLEDFARRGYLGVMAFDPFGLRLDGSMEHACAPETIASAVKQATDDLKIVLDGLGNEPEADMRHVVIVASGASAIAALSLAAQHVDGLEATVNISGGLYIRNCDQAAVNKTISEILSGIGADHPAPSLWLYADNNEILDQATTNAWHDTYVKAGGGADLAFIDMNGKPGYLLGNLPASFLKMTPHINGFLDNLGLPAVHEAEVDKLVARLGDEKFRNLARLYLVGPSYKALAVSQSGKWIGMDFSETVDIPAYGAALHDCNQTSGGEGCHILMLNNDYQQ